MGADAAPTGAGFREFDHTADLGFDAWGRSRDELFAQATLALAAICYEGATVRPRQRRELRAQGRGDEQLLVQWLQAVYLLLELDGWLLAGIEELHVKDHEVHGVLLGEPCDRQRHTLHTEIKAITYHDLRVRRAADGQWRTRVVVDV